MRRIGWRSAFVCAATLALLALWSVASVARAQAPFALDQLREGSPLGRHLAALEDSAHALSIAEVTRPEMQARFVPSKHDAPGYGITESSYWFRFTVQNESAEERPWLLEVGYPHLDLIELYVPEPGGSFRRRVTGDRFDFYQRELDHRNFVFRLREPPGATRTYYMRVRTTGSIALPLRAWTYESFVTHEGRETPVLWMFYGAVLIMAAYNLFLYVSLRQTEYLYYVLYELALAACQFTVTGHAFQHVIPHQPALVNQAVLFFVAMTFFWAVMFLRRFLRVRETLPRLNRVLQGELALVIVLLMVCPFVAYATALRAIVLYAVVLIPVSTITVVLLLRRRQRPAVFYALSWAAQFAGTLAYMLRASGVLPSTFFTEWGIQIGSTVEVLLLGLALADRINTLGAEMSLLNEQLSRNVVDLQGALAKAEEATRAKSEFLATMSHELRTPLNAIINLPQGLASEFVREQVIACRNCSALFQLEPGDPPIGPTTPCPDCKACGTLREEAVDRYAGRPELAIRHLKLIERSGKHLLQMVNGVLDFSKIEAGRLKLRLESVPVIDTVADAVETLSHLAEGAGVKLAFCADVDPDAALRGDPLRLKQILINLIGNAIKFSNGRGSVNVSVSKEESAYLFRVTDQGIGIAPEHRARIFESFEQIDRGETRRYGGTGLGLSISKSLVQMHGGRIWVESELGVGSTFAFLLPAGGPLGERSSEVDLTPLRNGPMLTAPSSAAKELAS